MEKKISLKTIISVTWLVVLIALWVTFQWLPGDIFMWMWIAIGWSFSGGTVGAIYFAAKSKRNLLIVSSIWIAILIVLWIDWFLRFLPRVEIHLAFSYAVQVAFLDEKGKLTKIIATHDVGKAINPMACAGQFEGGVHIGLGHTLSDNYPTTKGIPDSLLMRDLQIVKAKDTPEVEVILIEEPEEVGRFGSKGVGEICLVPTAGAVTGTLHQFDGKWRFELPVSRK